MGWEREPGSGGQRARLIFQTFGNVGVGVSVANQKNSHPGSLSEAPAVRDTLAQLNASTDHARVRWCALTLLLLACPPMRAPGAVDSGPTVVEVVDAGGLVTEARLAAWLSWQQAISVLPAGQRTDGGVGAGLRRRARQEAALLLDAGLSSDQVDAIEAVVAAVVAERNVARLTGAEALQQFRSGMAHLSVEQRLKTEAALGDLQAKSALNSLGAVETLYGVEAVRVVLTREAEVTRTWDALLEARGDEK